MVLSLLAVPAAAAPPDGNGNGGGGGNNAGAGSGGGGSGNDGGGNSGGGSGGGNSAGSGSSGSSGGSDDASGGGGNSGGNSASNGNSGGGNDASSGSNGNGNGISNGGNAAGNGNSANAGGGSTDGAPGNSGSAGPPDETGPPDDAGPPTVAVSTGSPDDAGERGPPAAPPGQSDGPSPSSVVDVAVSGAQAGDEVSIDVSTAAAEDDSVAFDGISVRVKRGGDFTMQVTNSEEALPGSPAFEPPAAAEALGRVRLEHSIANEGVEDVSFTFRVSKERLQSSDTDPETVSLYRFSEGEWATLETETVGETETHYIFQADSPGMSEFAIGAKRPEFDTYWADAEQTSATPGEAVSVSGRISNVGAADGVYEASLIVDGEVVSSRAVTIAAGGTRQVNFRTDFEQTGTYEVAVDEVSAGAVTVEAQSSGSEQESLSQVSPLRFERMMDVGRSLGTAVVSLVSGLATD